MSLKERQIENQVLDVQTKVLALAGLMQEGEDIAYPLFIDRDDLVERAIEIVRETQRASASLLQRRLRIGYPRAARLIDELEELGIVGPSRGGGREREVLMNKEEDEV